MRRQGFIENLDVLLITDSCTVTRRPGTEKEFDDWWGARPTPIMDCNTIIPVPFWTEVAPDGVVTKTHLCPDTCAWQTGELRESLQTDGCDEVMMVTAGSSAPPVAAGAPALAGASAGGAGMGAAAGAAGSSI